MQSKQPQLPSLNNRITLLDTDERATAPLQSLVLDHLLTHEGNAYWIDSHSHATPAVMNKITPSQSILKRIMLSRSFTPYQHIATIQNLIEHIPSDCSIAVLPEIDYFYHDESLMNGEGREMLEHVTQKLRRLNEHSDTPIIITESSTDGLSDVVWSCIDESLECRITSHGPRFSGAGYETLVYGCNGYVQTTLELWCEVLQQRYRAAGATEAMV